MIFDFYGISGHRDNSAVSEELGGAKVEARIVEFLMMLIATRNLPGDV